ncbi:hypothetical protein [Marinobacter xestospongiae]|uniref:4-amino-4-deoxy-L-arabinose transferase n=1 Tax=Marinobacter xestospongiae TaxID=994319 RepID=A0ABU3W053_9GAMM|nr:hypothetical protein [Marinobacter xestospongiae]MDV2079913.1 hypothetical protein [Marinobacter xestospongiae]
MLSKFKGIAIPLALTAFTLWLYYPALGFSYVWDDTLLFVDKVSLLNEPLSWELVSQPVLFGTTYFRPIVFLSWYAEFNIWGQSSSISHAINLLVHVLNTILLFYLAKLVVPNGKISTTVKGAIAAALYTLHPVMIESVAWVSGRFDLFVTFFIFLSSIVFLSERMPYHAKTGTIAILYLLALLSKELGIVLPVILYFIWMAKHGLEQRLSVATKTFIFRNKLLLSFLAIVVVIYFCLRTDAVGSVYHRSFNWFYITEAYFSDLMPFKAVTFYLYRAFLPFLSGGALHPYESFMPSPEESAIAIMVTLVGTAILIWGLLKNKNPLYWVFGASAVCLVLVLHIIPLSIGKNIGHDRFMATALGFFCISIVIPNYISLLGRLGVRRSLSLPILLVVVTFWISLALLTHGSFLRIWKDEFSLWQESYRVYPDFKAARYNYVYSALATGRLEVADEVLQEINKNEGFGIPEQALYADLLVRQGNPESLLYMEGLLSAIPKFHESDIPLEATGLFNVTPKHLGGVYSTYASALIAFSDDLEKARENNRVSTWYLEIGEQVPTIYQRAAIEYLDSNYDQASEKLKEALNLRQSGKIAMIDFFKTLIEKHCSNVANKDKEACIDFRNKDGNWKTVTNTIAQHLKIK